MSSTNRGAVRKPRDFYQTPHWCIRALINEMLPLYDVMALDPCAGDGRIGRALHAAGANVLSIDVEPLSTDVRNGEFLAHDGTHGRYDLIAANPPYLLAAPFLARALERGNAVAFLLRLNFLGSQRRADFLRMHPPKKVIVLTPRPSFTADGKTDSTEYCWAWFGDTKLLKDRTPFAWAKRDELRQEVAE